MLEKLISNLKQSLPGGAGKNAGNEAGAPGAPGAGKKNVNVQVAMAAAASGEEEAKKRNSMIVKVIVICGLAYLAVDELFLKEQAPVETTAAKPVKKPKKDKANKESGAEKPQGTPDASGAAQVTNQNPEVANPPVNNAAPPIENVNVLNKDNNQVAQQPVVEQPQQPAFDNSRIGEVNLDQKIDQIAKTVDQNQIQNQVEEIKIPSQPNSQSQSPNIVIHDPQPAETAPQTQRDTSMASKIVEDAVETPAPAYDQVGRGLVYNCKDKYWACLNKPAYLECNKNMKWNQASGKPAECVVQDIYNSDEDCSKVQKYHINVSTPTPFCN